MRRRYVLYARAVKPVGVEEGPGETRVYLPSAADPRQGAAPIDSCPEEASRRLLQVERKSWTLRARGVDSSGVVDVSMGRGRELPADENSVGDRQEALELEGAASRFRLQRCLRTADRQAASRAELPRWIHSGRPMADHPPDRPSRMHCCPSEILAECDLRDAKLRPQSIPGNRHPQMSAVDAGIAIS